VPRLIPDVVPEGALRHRQQPVLDAGDGLTLRPWKATDAAEVAAAFDDPEIRHWHHRSMTPQEAADWVTRTAAQWSDESDAEWAVSSGDGLLGRVALRDISLSIGQAELSFWTLPHARGRGVATSAASALAKWALGEIGFWRIEVRHSTRNHASCRVATRAGFRWEAELERQHIHDDGWHDVHIHTRFRSSAESGR
jgi:[ribosomal protein S5]-alanine N-acetyltransferase